jgi:aminoglycoside 3-N-acetyltransferase I
MWYAATDWTPVSTNSRRTVRRLVGSDIAGLRALNQLYADAFEDSANYTTLPPSDNYAQELLADDRTILLVAEAGGQVIGGLTAYVLPKPEQERSEIYVYDLAVASQHRRCGVATQLLGELQVIGKLYRCWCIYVQADYGDEPAIALYTKLGSGQAVLHFDLDKLPTGRRDR